MNEADKQKVIESYDARFKEYGYDPRTLGWGKARHRLRYHALLSQWELAGLSLLDFGCGFGDLYGYCIEKGLDVDYHGIDINTTLIEEGKRHYPEANLKVCDALNGGMSETFDIVVASGLFNTKIDDNQGFVESAFEFFRKTCKLGFAANFLSSNVDYRSDGLNYSDPGEILSVAYSCSRRLVLLNNYMPFEFTIVVYKDDTFDKEMIVFPDCAKFI